MKRITIQFNVITKIGCPKTYIIGMVVNENIYKQERNLSGQVHHFLMVLCLLVVFLVVYLQTCFFTLFGFVHLIQNNAVFLRTGSQAVLVNFFSQFAAFCKRELKLVKEIIKYNSW